MAMMAVLGELNDGAEIKDFKLLEQSMITIAVRVFCSISNQRLA
jgi:hypothetical protein